MVGATLFSTMDITSANNQVPVAQFFVPRSAYAKVLQHIYDFPTWWPLRSNEN